MRLPRREPADLGCTGRGRKRRVKRVDIERQVCACPTDDGAHTVGHCPGSGFMHFVRRDDRNSLTARPFEHLAFDRRANSNLNHAAWINEAFLDGVIEHRAMRVGLAEILRPRIHVCIKMNQRQRADPAGECAQQGQCHAVVPTQRNLGAKCRAPGFRRST